MAAVGLMTPLVATDDFKDPQFDCVIVVTDELHRLLEGTECLVKAIENHQKVDKSSISETVLIICDDLPSKRLIYSPTGPTDGDYDDVRLYHEAGFKAMQRAMAAGCKNPVLIRAEHDVLTLAGRVTCLGALQALYTPLEVREACPDKARKVEKMGIWAISTDIGDYMILALKSLESGRIVCRDIAGSDPERMAPPRAAEYLVNTFKDTMVKVDVISDLAIMEKEYPLLVAVNRAVRNVERQAPRIVQLEYKGQEPIDLTVMMVGKGVTYDTGGADVKYGGGMYGMHRDKGGAAAVAGLLQAASIWQPKGVRIIAALPFVRNSIGSDSYVTDEIITARSGVRVRVGNTDAEGRMIMADLLCQMRERATTINPTETPLLFTVATLTGHVIRTYGTAYTAAIDNGPAKKDGVAAKLQRAGAASGDPFEISTLRREDFAYIKGKSEYEDVIQSGSKPSSETERGHQSPVAFLSMVSGIDKHGLNSGKPLSYTHLDCAGSAGLPPQPPTGQPVVALSHAFGLIRESGTIIIPEHLH